MSSKYSEQVIEAACEAIDWTEGLVVTDALVLVVFDSLERAPWWEEVAGDYGVKFGEPFREECAGPAFDRWLAGVKADAIRETATLTTRRGQGFVYVKDILEYAWRVKRGRK
jgi:hypothetical protein